MRKIRTVSTIVGVCVVAVTMAPASMATLPGDNGKIAFATNRDGNFEIYAMNADGTGQSNVTNSAGLDGGPAWSPDGTKIAFHTNRDGNFEVYLMNDDGTGPTNLTNNAAEDVTPDWSPDGTKIAFQTDRDGNREIEVLR